MKSEQQHGASSRKKTSKPIQNSDHEFERLLKRKYFDFFRGQLKMSEAKAKMFADAFTTAG